MTEATAEGTPEELPDEELPESDARPDPEEYEPAEDTRAVSTATGTVYDETGEPAATPHDVAPAGEDDL